MVISLSIDFADDSTVDPDDTPNYQQSFEDLSEATEQALYGNIAPNW